MTRGVDALQAALRAEHAAVYGYGVLGARLRPPLRDTATQLWNAHRSARDALASRITGLGGRPDAAAAAYRLPVRVTSARTAAQLAAALEDDLVTAYTGLAGVPGGALRTLGAKAMQQAIARSVMWRANAGQGPPPAAFPGLPASALPPRPEPGEQTGEPRG
ncbi:ferritin-like domain-containing protein [Actinomadura parmotrematis]|uniref:Ferritin-like domain-containing protein n=1 Tax=Actinomadura parmotrematis TaxID=2864039 RepID=A0ABS7FTD0_9ACTN|nr:ferritin-like domain-containing protein [Actinomadura parmotrematis]MBW8483665.1 ferritin-like domain-containing protein [Actinomadura parmotrematis]